jgi:hypothetical protein
MGGKWLPDQRPAGRSQSMGGAQSSWESNVRYRIVTNGGRGRIILDGIDMLIRHVRARGWHLDGIYENRAMRPELQGQPLVRELNGPGWWEEGDCVMCEEREL